MSDYHEMTINLKSKDARNLHIENPAYMIDHGGRRLGIERRQFDYSHYFPERRLGQDRRIVPERRIKSRLNC